MHTMNELAMRNELMKLKTNESWHFHLMIVFHNNEDDNKNDENK